MSCEAKQEQVSLLIDAELEESDQVTLFRHLEACSPCRLFFDSMIRFRRATKTDQEEIHLAADEILPGWSPRPAGRRTSGDNARRWFPVLAGGWRMRVPVAVGLAAVLLIAGALVGSRISTFSRQTGRDGRAERTAQPTVVVVCSLPEVQVLGSGSRL